MAKIYISIVACNNLQFLPDCLNSVFEQTYGDFKVILVDNNSTDGTAEFIKNNYPQIKIIANKNNLGFSAGHNQAISLAIKNGAQYILITNPDIILERDYLERVVFAIEQNKKIAGVGGKLLKIFSHNQELKKRSKNAIIDSSGLKVFKSGQVVERGAGENDLGQYKKAEEVFGLSAALVLYRLSALEGIKVNKEYFDEDFFIYKEDIDLAWRLRLRGWEAWYIPEAIAYHYRGAYGEEKQNLKQVVKGRFAKSDFIKYHSYKNHLFLLFKNEFLSNFVRRAPFIIFYELKKFFYILFFERSTLNALVEAIKKFPLMLKKRKIILSKATIEPKEVKKWFV